MSHRLCVVFGVVGTLALSIVLAAVGGQSGAPTSCDDLLPPPRAANNKKVGPTKCVLIEREAVTIEGRQYSRLDVGLDGTVEGYLSKGGSIRGYLTNAPDLAFPQSMDPGPIFLGIANYSGRQGASMTIMYPRDAQAWNGKAYVTAHGGGPSFKGGNLRPWDQTFDPANAARGLDLYDRQMLAKGYVLVKTRRSAPVYATERSDPPVAARDTEDPGEITASLDDGSTIDYAKFNETGRYVTDFAAIAQRLVAQRLGRAPARTYFWGHSGGGRLGRTINYTPGLNRGADGKPIIDGFLIDDSATGLWLPVVMKDGRDVLFTTEAEKAGFVPQLDVTHQMYNRVTHSRTADPTWPPKKPDWLAASYVGNKRLNTRLLREKGLASKHRMYEVRHISHNNGGGGLDLSTMMDKFIDMLDAWVDKGVAPPPNRSDSTDLGDANRDGVIELAALEFPQAACPLGVFHLAGPGATSSQIAAFTGDGMEPLERGPGNQAFVDMNRNGVWDTRETVTEAWTRLGLLKRNEEFTREKYVGCVQAAAERLHADGFWSDRTVAAEVEKARTVSLDPKQTRTP